jgi:pyridoxine 5-phosphate synthase
MNKSPILLCVNIDHIATIRQARLGSEPSVVEAALIAEEAGADGITVHLREDRRHIQDADLPALKSVVKGRLTMEMAASAEMLQIANSVKPDLLTIVPEKRQELTTEGGLNVIEQADTLKVFLQKVQETSLKASLFIDPDLAVIEKAHQIGAKRIELHTGNYANCKPGSPEAKLELDKLKRAAEFAHSLGFIVNAGHGLNLQNLRAFIELPYLCELHIGHSIISRAVLVGLSQAVKEIKNII